VTSRESKWGAGGRLGGIGECGGAERGGWVGQGEHRAIAVLPPSFGDAW
jgi:hypothetical protein